MIVVLIGPIRQWWSEWGSFRHYRYVAWRAAAHQALVADGHLVYSSHTAFRGTWDERAQAVNDAAICNADVVVNLCPDDPTITAVGTEEEMRLCEAEAVPVIFAPPPTNVSATRFPVHVSTVVSAVRAVGGVPA